MRQVTGRRSVSGRVQRLGAPSAAQSREEAAPPPTSSPYCCSHSHRRGWGPSTRRRGCTRQPAPCCCTGRGRQVAVAQMTTRAQHGRAGALAAEGSTSKPDGLLAGPSSSKSKPTSRPPPPLTPRSCGQTRACTPRRCRPAVDGHTITSDQSVGCLSSVAGMSLGPAINGPAAQAPARSSTHLGVHVGQHRAVGALHIPHGELPQALERLIHVAGACGRTRVWAGGRGGGQIGARGGRWVEAGRQGVQGGGRQCSAAGGPRRKRG